MFDFWSRGGAASLLASGKMRRPPGPVAKGRSARPDDFGQGLAPVVPFLNQRLADTQPMALDGRPAVGTNANLRKACDLLCHSLCLRACASLRREVFAQADRHALLGRHLASGKDNS